MSRINLRQLIKEEVRRVLKENIAQQYPTLLNYLDTKRNGSELMFTTGDNKRLAEDIVKKLDSYFIQGQKKWTRGSQYWYKKGKTDPFILITAQVINKKIVFNTIIHDEGLANLHKELKYDNTAKEVVKAYIKDKKPPLMEGFDADDFIGFDKISSGMNHPTDIDLKPEEYPKQ